MKYDMLGTIRREYLGGVMGTFSFACDSTMSKNTAVLDHSGCMVITVVPVIVPCGNITEGWR